jgi:hypothetical protein
VRAIRGLPEEAGHELVSVYLMDLLSLQGTTSARCDCGLDERFVGCDNAFSMNNEVNKLLDKIANKYLLS